LWWRRLQADPPTAHSPPCRHSSGRGIAIAEQEDRDWQRLDKWLWCARFMRSRSDCAELAAKGSIRINRQPTDKPHARLRVGDVLTVPLHTSVRVVRVLSLAARRGPAPEARLLYEEISDTAGGPCATT
jgi:ribosome-associated heat shock protein Hsp15